MVLFGPVRLVERRKTFSPRSGTVSKIIRGKLEVPLYVMGDFSRRMSPGKAYDYIFSHSNLTDTFKIAEVKDSNLTLTGAEEWKDPKTAGRWRGSDPDRFGEPVLNSEVLFQGKRYPRISDHLRT